MPEITATWMRTRPQFFLLAEGVKALDVELDSARLLAVSTRVAPRDGDLIIARRRGRIVCSRNRTQRRARIEGVVVGIVTVNAFG